MEIKNTLALLIAALACSLAQAATITDDFNRADTALSTDALISVGPGWVNGGDPLAEMQISTNAVHSGTVGATGPLLLVNTQLETLSDGALTEFTLSGIIQQNHTGGSGWAGLVFNYQDADNYYLLRYDGIETVQLIIQDNGALKHFTSWAPAFSHVQNRPYKLTVFSREGDTFDFTMHDMVTDTDVFSDSYTIPPIVKPKRGGYGGFYASIGGVGTFDDFNLSALELSPTAVVDNFDRADTAANHDASVSIGSHWQDGSGVPATQYKIGNQNAKIDGGTGPWIIVNDELGTLNEGAGTNFTLIGTIQLFNGSPSAFAGLVFNYQDSSNYYEMRFDGTGNIQFIPVGGSGFPFNATASFAHVPGTPYEFTITSTDPYHFNLSIRDTVTDIIVHSSGPHIDTLENFTDGLGGFYRNTGLEPSWDSFYLDSTGAPAPESGYTQWAAGWGVDIGNDQNDPDFDGLVNVYEYGLGGDPTNGLDQGTTPEFGIAGGQFSYIHPQVADLDSGIAYSLELTEDLVIGPWTNAGYTVEGTNDTGLALDFVSNTTTTVESEKFIQLIIELK